MIWRLGNCFKVGSWCGSHALAMPWPCPGLELSSTSMMVAAVGQMRTKTNSECEGGSEPNSICGSRQALITLLFNCASMLRDLLCVLSLLLVVESQGLQVASAMCIPVTRISPGKTAKDALPTRTTKQACASTRSKQEPHIKAHPKTLFAGGNKVGDQRAQ